MSTELINSLVSRWDKLSWERMDALAAAMKDVLPVQRTAVIEQFNESRYYEDQFDELEMKIRALDPDHEYLPENSSF